MRALVKSKSEQGIWLEDIDKPSCGSNDVLIKIKQTAICGTDVHIYNWDQWLRKPFLSPCVSVMNLLAPLLKLAARYGGSKLVNAFQAKDTSPVAIVVIAALVNATFVATPMVSVLIAPAPLPSI